VYFFFKQGPGLGQDAELVGYGLKIPDRTFNVCVPRVHRVKFSSLLSSLGAIPAEKYATDIQTTSVEHFLFKSQVQVACSMYAKN
jgi:hypothetical protein